MSVNGQIELPIKGFSAVDTLDVGIWVQILDSDNANTPTTVVNFGAGNVAIPMATVVNVITPVALAATENNYGPASWATGTVFRLTPAGGGSVVTGFDFAAVDSSNYIRTVRNASTVDGIQINHEDAGSLANNRVTVPGGANYIVLPKGSVTLFKDVIEGRWTFI